MEYSRFIKLVKERAGLDTEEDAIRATGATLATLSQRLAGNEPADLASQLPIELQAFLSGAGGAEDFGVMEFYNRVAGLEGISPEEASKHVRAVMNTVSEAISGGEAVDIMSQLPVEYGQIFYIGGDNLANPENWTNSPGGF